MGPTIKRIGLNTGGGDAPGLNAVIHAVTISARQKGWRVTGIKKGLTGLFDVSETVELDEDRVRGISHMGGTILGTTNRGNPFEYPTPQADGSVKAADRSGELLANFKKLGLDALITIGGDGSLRIGKRLQDLGMPVVAVPKTIDNDLLCTVTTFGFDTAVTTATEAIERVHDTAESHSRVIVVEVMGRYAGWIALNSGISSSSDVILIPEIPFDIEKVCDAVRRREARGRHYTIVVAAEGARPLDGAMSTVGEKEIGREVRLGGISALVADEIQKRTGKETRNVVLGHIQRGGRPTSFDRLIAARFGVEAVEAVERGRFGCMVALKPPSVELVPIEEAVAKLKTVPLDSDSVFTARRLGICLGD